ncbi:hypothetical protein SAMN04487977_106113 [Treponema bryantii]|uniref:Permease n=1 Tax=Treponema bryantii TaxID=163 RepID=A0A1H9HAH1_9SPIR|nr:hypothetical protein [Treponema bryantii]SEQ59320.1 hypothetical protein SAMN04487977_106113 [Treponema bryantii]
MFYKNFKTVTYCVAAWVNRVTEEQLRKDADFLQKYVKIDKIYLETYRDEFASREQIEMIKRVMKDYGIEVSGGITTVTPDLNESDKKRQRLFNTFCYCNEPMRARLKEVSEYTAVFFDEFIIDDFFFTQCMCEDCIREKGNRSWKEFRLAKMMEVSRDLIIGPAKKVNPKVHIIIKYPNWRESFQETGYNPGQQREIFDSIYTGTETRHGAQQDQHLPRYLSYSLMRYFESVAPGRNGGGWFDPYDCDRFDTYLEQAYLTAFAKPKEIMMFCWPSIAGNKRATPLGFMYDKLDRILGRLGEPCGLKTYIPFNSQGDDHIEDFIGMVGVPMEPCCEFLEFSEVGASRKVLVTAASLEDSQIVGKLRRFVEAGGHAIATSSFMIGALQKYPEISELTSVTYTNRVLSADEFQTPAEIPHFKNYVKSAQPIEFPLLEHRNNATWSIMNAGHGEYHESILCYDTYGKGRFTVLSIPEMPSKLYDLPAPVLTAIRRELDTTGIWIDGGSGVSLFTYDNKTFGIYCYAWDGCVPQEFHVHIKGRVKELVRIPDSDRPEMFKPQVYKPLYVKEGPDDNAANSETVFYGRATPGEFDFFEIKE